jgi:hypothetical protein
MNPQSMLTLAYICKRNSIFEREKLALFADVALYRIRINAKSSTDFHCVQLAVGDKAADRPGGNSQFSGGLVNAE